MLSLASKLSDANEYFVVFGGQSNSRPWGTTSDGFSNAPELNLSINGGLLATLTISGGNNAGTNKVIPCGTALSPNAYIGMQLRLNKTTGTQHTQPCGGYAIVRSNSVNSLTVDWQVDMDNTAYPNGTYNGWLTYEDGKWLSYPGVRVLTPYQPEPSSATSYNPYPATTTSPVRLPGLSLQAGMDSFAKLAALLPLTFKEGIDSHGLSETTDTYTGIAHGFASSTVNTFLVADVGNTVPRDCLAGGYLRVEWTTSSTRKLSWARLASNSSTAGTCTMNLSGAWQGDGDPNGGTGVTFEAWVPYFNNNPHAYLPGRGFRYPNNDMMPCWQAAHFTGTPSVPDARILNRPRGITGSTYNGRFGTLIRFAWMLSVALGKRINVILLGVNSSAQAWAKQGLGYGFNGTVGWYDWLNVLDWTPADPTGLGARLDTLLSQAQNAVTAEGTGKTAKVLGTVWLQGEGDALIEGARLRFAESLSTFKSWLRRRYDELGLNPYGEGAKVPFVQAEIMHTPYELQGTFNYYGVPVPIDGDADGLVNSAIISQAALDGFSDTTNIDDLPRLDAGTATEDLGHLSGVGEAEHGVRLADAMLPLIERALQFGSTALSGSDTAAVAVCNQALANIGDAARITSLTGTDTSPQATKCAQFYARAVRAVLSAHAWTFASKRVTLKALPESPSTSWDYAYGLPGDCVTPVAVLPPDATSDVAGAAPTVFQVQDLLNTNVNPTPFAPIQFNVEDYQGGRVLFTDQAEAELRYTAMVMDTTRWTPLFENAVAWYLGSMLAGPLVKGEAGASMTKHATGMTNYYLGQARMHDANQSTVQNVPQPRWLTGRG